MIVYLFIYLKLSFNDDVHHRKLINNVSLFSRKIYKEEFPAIPEQPSFTTPPNKSVTPRLPEVTRGKIFLPEDDDLGLGVLPIEEQITPPQSLCKKLKPDRPEIVKAKLAEQPTCTAAVDDTESYSHLMYVESTGVLGRLNKSKHRGVTTRSEAAPSPSSPVLEKETTLKISYRIRLRDNAIYFCLIIYERIASNNNLRRNLCLDFDVIEEQERRETILTARSLETPKKRKTPLKRLMFI